MRMRTISRGHDKGRDILEDHRACCGHAVRTDLNELVNQGSSAQNHTVADMHMACDRRIICNDDVVAQHNRERHEHKPLAGYCCRFA